MNAVFSEMEALFYNCVILIYITSNPHKQFLAGVKCEYRQVLVLFGDLPNQNMHMWILFFTLYWIIDARKNKPQYCGSQTTMKWMFSEWDLRGEYEIMCKLFQRLAGEALFAVRQTNNRDESLHLSKLVLFLVETETWAEYYLRA